MIEVRVRFWTDDIADGKGKIVPKHGWTGGVVRIATNKAHGVTAAPPLPFNSLAELPAAIEKVLAQSGVKLHLTGKARKVIAD